MREQYLRSKKGQEFFLNEIPSLFFAAIIIVVLVSLGISIYFILQNNHEKEQARANLDEILSKVKFLGKNNVELRHVYTSPKEWSIVFYDSKGPVVCKGESCLCICPVEPDSSDTEFFMREKIIKICSDKGVCSPAKNIIVKGSNAFPGKFIYFSNIPITLYLKNDSTSIIISYVAQNNEDLERLMLEKVSISGVEKNIGDAITQDSFNNCRAREKWFGKYDVEEFEEIEKVVTKFLGENYQGAYIELSEYKDLEDNLLKISFGNTENCDNMGEKVMCVNTENNKIIKGIVTLYTCKNDE